MKVNQNLSFTKGAAMTLTELSAFEAAYQALAPLDETARRRALQWLSDALGDGKPLAASPSSVNGNATDIAAATTNPPQTAKPAARRRNAAATSKAHTATATARSRKRKAASKVAAVESGREYRRMPDPDEVMNAYHEIGTVSGLAEYFDVPQHTVTHWARRLRSLGYQIGRNA